MNIFIPNDSCLTDYVDKIIFTLRFLVGLENDLNLPLISGITDNGDTLLHLAVILNRPVSTLLEIMLSDSSLISIENKDGCTPFDLAKKNKYCLYQNTNRELASTPRFLRIFNEHSAPSSFAEEGRYNLTPPNLLFIVKVPSYKFWSTVNGP
jgi:hypothetical protein